MTAADCTAWVQFPFERCVEMVTARRCASEFARAAPGSVLQNRYAHLGLHFAPRRWLLLEPEESLIADLLWSGTRYSEASGKWKFFTAAISSGRLALATTVDLEEILRARRCARTRLFDCPVVLAQLEYSFLACVESSYEVSWSAAVHRTTSPSAY
jgi:hypothetical protein